MRAIKTRLAVVLGAAAAVLAVSAPAATAVNPDFPHNDYNAANWHSVFVVGNDLENPYGPCYPGDPKVGSCKFSLFAGAWLVETKSASFSCEMKMSGSMTADGTFTVTSASIQRRPGGYGDYRCELLQPAELPWSSTACVYKNTGASPHEFWLRLKPTLYHSYSGFIKGETFGKFNGTMQGSGGVFTSLGFQGASFGDGGLQGWAHTGTFGLDKAIEMDQNVEYEEVPDETCSWPEL